MNISGVINVNIILPGLFNHFPDNFIQSHSAFNKTNRNVKNIFEGFVPGNDLVFLIKHRSTSAKIIQQRLKSFV